MANSNSNNDTGTNGTATPSGKTVASVQSFTKSSGKGTTIAGLMAKPLPQVYKVVAKPIPVVHAGQPT